MRRLIAIAALTILTACDYIPRNDLRAERDDRIYRAAMDDYRAGRMDAAIAGLEKAVRNDPSNASARFQLACLQQDLKKDFLSAFCSYREFLVQRPDCDRAKLARERLAACEKEIAGILSSRYGLNASESLTRELGVVRNELKAAKARVATVEKELASSQEKASALSADHKRLLAVVKGEASEEGVGGDRQEVMREKDLLDADEEGEDLSPQSILKEKALLDAEDEASTSSSLLPVRKAESAAKSEGNKKAPDKTSEKKADRPKTYVVEEGDTLYGIAKRFYGSIRPWKAIREANKALISSDNRLRAGDTIVLP